MATVKGKPPSEPPSVGPPSGRMREMTSSLGHLDVEMTPDTFVKVLEPGGTSKPDTRLRPLWHRVGNEPVITIRLTSTDDRHRIVRLSLESEDHRWNPKWVKWRFIARRATELMGGDALDAQDVLTPDGAILNLLVAAGESREARVEIDAFLDGYTQTGDYLFDLVVEDLTDAEEGEPAPATTVPGILKITHPPCRLLDELPSIYREAMYPDGHEEHPVEPVFFERYMLGFEDAFKVLRATLSNLDRLFGPFSTPPDLLVWLAVWVCMPLDENWPEMRRRRLIREAVELYRWRGTRYGLSRYLRIYTGVEPEINDVPFVGMRLGPDAKLGTDATILGDVPPHTFVVTLATPDPDSLDEKTIRDIIRWEKPAHTAYTLNIVRGASPQQ